MVDSLLTLDSAGDVIDAVGGSTAAARLCGVSVQQMSNSRGSNRMPRSTFLIFQEALAGLGKRGRPELWGIIDPRSRR